MQNDKIQFVAETLSRQRFLRTLPSYHRNEIKHVTLKSVPDLESQEDARVIVEAIETWEKDRMAKLGAFMSFATL